MADALPRRLRLVLVTPGDRDPAATEALVEACVDGGVTAVWLREPQLDDAARRALAERLVPRLRAAGAFTLLARDAALAAELGADAVQLGHASPAPDAVRAAHPGLRVGRSAHWPLHADDLAADFVTLSPFAPTPRSHPRPLLQPAQVDAALERLAPRPVIALGGLDASAVDSLPPGVTGLAVKRALCDAGDPRGAAAVLRSLLDAHLDFGGPLESFP